MCGNQGKQIKKLEYLENEKSFLDEMKSKNLVQKLTIIGTNFKPNNIGALMNTEKLNEFNYK